LSAKVIDIKIPWLDSKTFMCRRTQLKIDSNATVISSHFVNYLQGVGNRKKLVNGI